MKLKKSTVRSCPICRGRKLLTIARKATYIPNLSEEVEQTYVLCSTCLFVFTKDPLTSQALARYYATNTQERRPTADASERKHIEEQLAFLRGSLSFREGIMLEVGANNGTFLEAAAELGMTGYYSELNKDSLKILKEKKMLSDFSTLSKMKARGAFDYIVLLHTLEHIVNPRQFIATWGAYLKDGGSFFIEVPDFTFNDSDTDKFIFEHVNFFSSDSLRQLFESAGFTVVASQIALDRGYPACPHYVVRMIATKSREVFSPKPSLRVKQLRLKEQKRTDVFKRLNMLLKNMHEDARIGIYSASWLTDETLSKSNLLKMNVVGIFDRDRKKQGTSMKGITIFSPDEILSKKLDKIFVLNEGYEKEICDYLEHIGYPKELVVRWSKI